MPIKLRDKISRLEVFNKIVVEREMRIIDLKEEVNALTAKLGESIRYPEVWQDKQHTVNGNIR